MITIGIDPQKRTHTATALDDMTHHPVGSLQVEPTLVGYRDLRRWARSDAGRWRTPADWAAT